VINDKYVQIIPRPSHRKMQLHAWCSLQTCSNTKKRCFKSYPKKSSPQGVLTGSCFQPHPLNNEAARPVDPAAGPCAETAHGRRPEPAWVQKCPLLISYYETITKWNMLFHKISYEFIGLTAFDITIITTRHTPDARDFGVGVGQCSSTLPTSSWAACHVKYPGLRGW
jgi:hypothetical protein